MTHAAYASQFSYSEGRTVHVRRYGDGPPVVLLHESPRSTHVLDPLARGLAREFSVIAVDTPGYGLSDPLPLAHPEMEDFADAILIALKQIGLGHAPVYGTHTGATIAVAMGLRDPQFVSGLVLDGYPIFTAREREDLEATYLVAFDPDWQGRHVVGLWSRVRDQFGFFPWYLRGPGAALGARRPTLSQLRAVFKDFLRSGAAYAAAYAASFRYLAAENYQRLTIPCHTIARDTDLLHGHLDRFPAPSAGNTITSCSSDLQIWTRSVAELLRAIPGGAWLDPNPTPQRPHDGALIATGATSCARLFGSPAEAAPLVLLHDIPGSGRSAMDAARRMGRIRPVILPEMPGCGLTESRGSATLMDDLVAQTHAALDIGGHDTAELGAIGRSSLVAAALAQRSSRLHPPPDTGTPKISDWQPVDGPLPERWDGANLLALWYNIREMELVQAGAEARLAGVDIIRLHHAFVAHCLADGRDLGLLDAARADLSD